MIMFKGKDKLYSRQKISQPISPGRGFNNLIFNLLRHSLSLNLAFVEFIEDSKTLWSTYLYIVYLVFSIHHIVTPSILASYHLDLKVNIY